MKLLLKILFLLLFPFFTKANNGFVDSLYNKYNQATTDSARYYYLHRIYGYYEEVQKDSALVLVNKMLALAQKK